MKKVIILLSALIIASNAASAEKVKERVEFDRNETSLSVGFIGLGELTCLAVEIFSLGFASTLEDAVCYPSTSFQYIRYVNNRQWGGRFGVGAQISHQFVDSTSPDFNKMHFLSFIPMVKVFFYADEIWGIYGKAGAGATANFVSDDEPGIIFMGHLSVGVHAGGPRLKGFLELGGGPQGMISAGIQYSF